MRRSTQTSQGILLLLLLLLLLSFSSYSMRVCVCVCVRAQCNPTGIADVQTGPLFANTKLSILIAVPGAFTPGCSQSHLPPLVQRYDELKALGVDLVCCMAVNDGYCMKAWGIDQKVGSKVMMLADGSGSFTKALGMELDLAKYGMGVRSRRFALIIKDGKVQHVFSDVSGVTETHADNLIKTLKASQQ